MLNSANIAKFSEVMAEEEAKKVEPKPEPEASCDAPPPEPVEAPKDVAEEKSVIPPPAEEKPDDSKALAIVESNSLITAKGFLSFSLYLGVCQYIVLVVFISQMVV